MAGLNDLQLPEAEEQDQRHCNGEIGEKELTAREAVFDR